jgi:hypothetical protein
MGPAERSAPVFMDVLFCDEGQLLMPPGDVGQLLMRECQLLRDVFGRGFQRSNRIFFPAGIFIDRSFISVNVRGMLLGVVSGQWSVVSGKWSQTGDGNGSVRLLCAARERGPLRWWTGETRPGRRRDAGSGWYFSCCRRYEFCFIWYEFCSFLLFFVRVLLYFVRFLLRVFWEKPRFLG